MSSSQLRGWTPVEVTAAAGQRVVDWCNLGDRRFLEPFFEQTLRAARRDPAREFSRQRTPIAALEEFADAPECAPTGFIFHLSRCGSTLIAQLLAASARHRVISEAPLIDRVLRPLADDPPASRAQRVRWLRGVVHALGQRRGAERRYFVKFDCWHTLELALVREAFPDVPWIFVMRDPVEILVSHQRIRGRHMIPGALNPPLFALPPAMVAGYSLDEYGAAVLAQICVAVLPHLADGRGRVVDFRSLPDALWTQRPSWFGIDFTSEEIAQMRAAAKFHAKNPAETYADDSADKRAAASAALQALAQARLGDLHARLLARCD